jgi:hypothetical protein
MPRRKAPTTAAAAGGKAPPSKAHKRQLSSPAVPAATATPGSRQSKRIKAFTEHTPTNNSKNVTPKKSKYFEAPDSDEDEDEDDDAKHQGKARAAAAAEEEETSGYSDEEASASHASSAQPSTASSSSEEASDSDDPRKKGRNKKKKNQQANKRQPGKPATHNAPSTTLAGASIEKGKELWRQGVKVGLGPGKEVFIERPKARGDGGIKYVPGRIHPNTMAFLGDLKANNEREWLKCEWAWAFLWAVLLRWVG